MSYIIEKYKNEEVAMQGLAVGWYFKETDEFRPLMKDAVMELFLAGLIDDDIVYHTNKAREDYMQELIDSDYFDPEPIDENIFVMTSEFDDGIDDVYNGDIIQLADY